MGIFSFFFSLLKWHFKSLGQIWSQLSRKAERLLHTPASEKNKINLKHITAVYSIASLRRKKLTPGYTDSLVNVYWKGNQFKKGLFCKNLIHTWKWSWHEVWNFLLHIFLNFALKACFLLCAVHFIKCSGSLAETRHYAEGLPHATGKYFLFLTKIISAFQIRPRLLRDLHSVLLLKILYQQV